MRCTFISTNISLKSEFLDLSTSDIWGRITVLWGTVPMHCRMFSSTPGVYPLDASSDPHHAVTTKKVSSIVKDPLEDKTVSPLKSTTLKF